MTGLKKIAAAAARRVYFKEIEDKITFHEEKRLQMREDAKARCIKNQTEILEKFKSTQLEAVDDFSAKEASGKVFGRPRRAAQEIVRSEITLSMTVQDTLNNLVEEIQKILDQFNEYQEYSLSPEQADKSEAWYNQLTQDIRFKLMTLRKCCYFYGMYLEAYKPECPLEEIQRFSYNECKLD